MVMLCLTPRPPRSNRAREWNTGREVRRWTAIAVALIPASPRMPLAATTSGAGATCRRRSFVPAIAPDTIPSWIYADSVLVRDPPGIGFPFPKNIIALKFEEGTSQDLMQAAVGIVCGVVVGGLQPLNVYYIKVPSDRTGKPLFAAIRKLKRLSQVSIATPSILAVGND